MSFGIPLPVALGESICPYCGVGCRLDFEGTAGGPLKIRGVLDAPANLGRICAKGALLGPTIDTDDRLTQPLLRTNRPGKFRPATLDAAVGHVARKFREIIDRHGPDAVAFYGSGQLDTETAYLACKLFKGTLFTNNTDSNSRLCMASTVAGYRTSLGSDGPPGCYEDVDLADVIFILGSNTAEAHPVLFDRIRDAKRVNPALTIVVADPRRTLTARDADVHLAVRPGGDIALLNAIGRLLLDAGSFDGDFIVAHTVGARAYAAFLRSQDLDSLCSAAGLPREQLEAVARRIGAAKGFLSFYCMGLNQSSVGTWKNNSVINLHLLTGQIGKPGAGPFSLTGQPNAMGGREAGLLAQQLPGYRTVDDATHRAEVERYWGRPAGSIRPQPGLSAVEMFRSLESGKLKAIWIAGTNPLVSLPDLHQARRALARAELVVVQDTYHPTETTQQAHVLLPVAQWGEKEWTSTSSERLVSWSPRLFNPPGEAVPDWQLLCRFARAYGLPGFDFADASEVWEEFRGLTTGRPCDMTGITARRLRADRHVYWPCQSDDDPGQQRRYLDGIFPTPDGRARFLPRDHRPPREGTDHEFPFVLTTGRLYTHWHTLTRTAKCDKLVLREPGPYVELHPADAVRLGVGEGELVQLSSRRGTIQLPARLSDSAAPGTVFVPFHWGDLFAQANAANYLTISATDTLSKQPELKFCAVALEKVRVESEGSAPAPDSRPLLVPVAAEFLDDLPAAWPGTDFPPTPAS
jgi:ferredoxin-nitrate reductase